MQTAPYSARTGAILGSNAESTGLTWRRLLLGPVSIALAAALFRLVLLVRGSGPLGDGGMFVVMIDDIRAAHFGLPVFTSYNDAHIPFSYPPLAFYVAAALSAVTGMSASATLMVLPFLFSIATVVAFYWLARNLGLEERRAFLATALFAFSTATPWLVMGGGLTRSLGLLFSLLSANAFCLAQRRPRRLRSAFLAGLLLGLAALSHPEMAMIGVIAIAAIAIARTSRMRDFAIPALVGIVAILVALPWLVVVLDRYGISPFVAARGAGGPLWALPAAFVCLLLARRWLIPSMALACLLLTRNAAFPLSIFGSMWLAQGLAIEARATTKHLGLSHALQLSRAALLGIAILAWLGFFWVGIAPLKSRTDDETRAFAWVTSETAPGRSFVVLSGIHSWGNDFAGEWFPALADRRSVATVQGTEWLQGDSGVLAASRRFAGLARCAEHDTTCLDDWSSRWDRTFDYVFIDGRCCSALNASLRGSTQYEKAYKRGNVTIYRVSGRAP